MKCSAIQCEIFNEDTLHPLLQQMFKVALLCTESEKHGFHSSVASTTTVCCMSVKITLAHCCSRSLKCLKSPSKWSTSILFSCKFFHQFVSCKIFKLIQIWTYYDDRRVSLLSVIHCRWTLWIQCTKNY